MKSLIVSIAICCALPASSQQKQKIKINIIPEIGVLNGNKIVSGMHSLSALVFRNSWAFGAGAGIDYYKVRSVPVFLLGRKEFGKNEQRLFAYSQLGYNIAAPLQSQYMRPSSWFVSGGSSFSNGIFSETGLGVAWLNKKNRGLEFAIGYSMKTLTEHYSETIYGDFPPYNSVETQHSFRYGFNRLVAKLGFRF